MSLPIDWIEALFKRFLGLYGNRFTRMWEGLDIEDVKQSWARELSGVRGDAIKYAIEHLPESMPPTVLEFRKLCHQAPAPNQALLPGPKLDRDEAAKRAKDLRIQIGSDVSDGRAWARRLLARAEAGERLPVAHVQMARQALESWQ